jgi:FtsH-binding integral membrane protein
MSDPPQKAKKIYPTAIVAAVFAFSCSQPMWGFLAFLWAIPVFIWMLFQLAHALFHAEARKNCALRVGIWVFAFALVFGINVFRDRSIRQQADEIVAKI